MVEITSKTTTANFNYSDETYLISGEYRANMEGKMESVSMNITDTEKTYKGSANAYPDGDNVKYNISSVDINDMSKIAQSLKTCVDELKVKVEE